MSTNPSTQADEAMKRIRQHTNRSAGQHLSAVRSTSTTTDPLLLRTERLHRVDASQLPADVGVSLGHCRTDGIACFARPGVMCMHDAKCHDTHCAGHPVNNGGEYTPGPQTPSESRSLLAWLVALVVFGLLAGAMALLGAPHDH